MPLTSQDFQNVAIRLEDLTKALNENTEAMRKVSSSGGGGAGGPGALNSLGGSPGGAPGPSGGRGSGQSPDGSGGGGDSAGFSLSGMGRLMTTAAPGSSGLGFAASLTSAAATGNPMAVLGATVGMVAQTAQESSQQAMGVEEARYSALAGSGHLSQGQQERAELRAAHHAGNMETIKAGVEDATSMFGDLGRGRGNASRAAEREASEQRQYDDRLNAEQGARARTNSQLRNLREYGDLEHNSKQREAYQRALERNFKKMERIEANDHVIDALIDHIKPGRPGAHAVRQNG